MVNLSLSCLSLFSFCLFIKTKSASDTFPFPNLIDSSSKSDKDLLADEASEKSTSLKENSKVSSNLSRKKRKSNDNPESSSKFKITLSPGVKVDYDHDRFEILLEPLSVDVLAEIAAGYDYDNHIQVAYNEAITERCKSISTPSSSCESLMSVIFTNADELEKTLLNETFITNLSNLFKGLRLDYNSPFSMSFHKFIFKCLLEMRQKYLNNHGQDQENWEKIVEKIKSLDSVIEYSYLEALINILEWQGDFENSFSASFFEIECMRNWKDYLKPKLEEFLYDLYSTENESCITILSKHFNKRNEIEKNERASFNNFRSYMNRDPLLTFLWKNQDSISWEKCFSSFKTLNLSNLNVREKIQNSKLERIHARPLVFNSDFLFSVESDLKLALENNHKIDFDSFSFNNQSFLKLLKILQEINLLTWKNFLNIFDFGNINEISKHLKLKNLFLKKMESFKESEISSICIGMNHSINDYEKEL